MFDKVFLTGCDEKTEWMLEWWVTEYSKNNDIPIIFADFGISDQARKYVEKTFSKVIDLTPHKDVGWFLKPEAMIAASKLSKKVCWIDTDCHILDDISDIFTHTEFNKLCMAEDVPWSVRRGSKWHNSGVVAFEGCPTILKNWKSGVEEHAYVGDQEVLHIIMRSDPLTRHIHIIDLPNEYNWLRLQIVDDDGHIPTNVKIIHWTGYKGKIYIKEMIKNG